MRKAGKIQLPIPHSANMVIKGAKQMTKNIITVIKINGKTKIYINYDLAKQLKREKAQEDAKCIG